MTQVNARVHRVTRRAPDEMLARGTGPAAPDPGDPAHRRVRGDPDGAGRRRRWSPSRAGSTRSRPGCSGRRCGCGCTATAPTSRSSSCTSAPTGPVEVARHARATPGSPKIDDAHFPPAPAGALDRKPLARNAAEAEFLALGDGARLWLTEAAAAGTDQDPGQDGPGRDPGEAVRRQGRGLGAGPRRGPRPVRRGRPRLDPGPPPHRHGERSGQPGRRGRLADPGHRQLGRPRRPDHAPATAADASDASGTEATR